MTASVEPDFWGDDELDLWACCPDCGREPESLQPLPDGWVWDSGEMRDWAWCPDCKPGRWREKLDDPVDALLAGIAAMVERSNQETEELQNLLDEVKAKNESNRNNDTE